MSEHEQANEPMNESAESATNASAPSENQSEEHKPVKIDLQELLEAVQQHGQKTVDQQDEAAKGGQDYDDAILDSSAIEPTDTEGNPIPVTIPIVLAPGVTVVYTTRLGGVSEGAYSHFNLGGKGGDEVSNVLANRKALAEELHVKLALISQVHSNTAVDIDEVAHQNRDFGFDASGLAMPLNAAQENVVDDVEGMKNTEEVIEADAMVTTQKGIALGVFAADCLPVLLADPVAGVIAAAHAGRLGLEKGVIGATVEMMEKKGAKREHILATLGPAICGDCYEVGDEVADEFENHVPGTYTLTRFGGPGIDLNKAAIEELAEAGVKRDHIMSSQPRVNAATQYLSEDSELQEICKEDNEGDPELAERIKGIRHSMCTLENPLWFSHRRAQLAHKEHEGRMLALIVRQ